MPKICINISLLLLLSGVMQGQRRFEGRVFYKITYLNVQDSLMGIDHVMPETAVLYVRGDAWRLDQRSRAGDEIVWISTGNNDTIYQQMILADECLMVARSFRVVDHKLEVIKTNEKSEIAGKSCTNWTVKDEQGAKSEAWLMTKSVNPKGFYSGNFEALPLVFDFSHSDVRMRLEAVKIVAEPMDNTYFEVPALCKTLESAAFAKLLR